MKAPSPPVNTHHRHNPITRTQRVLVATCGLAVCCSAWADDAPTLVPVDGPPSPAAIAALESDGTVTVDIQGTRRKLPLNTLVRWGAYRDSYRGTHVVLTDGSLIVAELLDVGQEVLTLVGDLCGEFQAPISRVRGVIFDPPVDTLLRDRLLQRLAAARGVADQVLLKNGDVIEGAVQGIGESTDTTQAGEYALQLVSDGHPLEISLEKILAVVFNPALAQSPPQGERRLLMGFEDGSLLDVRQIAAAGALTQLTLACNVSLDVDPELIRSELRYLFPSSDRVQYVSDLTPLSFKHIPWLDESWPLQLDRSATGGRLRWGGRIYAKGLGMHSASSVAYQLDDATRRFDAELAIDQRAGVRGSVVFRVFLYDAAGKRGLAYESPVVRGGDVPLAISVDVSAARVMALVVDYSDRGHVLDHANWLDARLIRDP